MAACPFSELYFLAGFYNGCVALYSRLTEKPLIVMVSKNLESRVEQIEWSCSRPCVFYVKHENVVDVWDLMYSDMVPVCSVPFKKQLECIKEMPTKENYRNLKKSCMVSFLSLQLWFLYIFLLFADCCIRQWGVTTAYFKQRARPEFHRKFQKRR